MKFFCGWSQTLSWFLPVFSVIHILCSRFMPYGSCESKHNRNLLHMSVQKTANVLCQSFHTYSFQHTLSQTFSCIFLDLLPFFLLLFKYQLCQTLDGVNPVLIEIGFVKRNAAFLFQLKNQVDEMTIVKPEHISKKVFPQENRIIAVDDSSKQSFYIPYDRFFHTLVFFPVQANHPSKSIIISGISSTSLVSFLRINSNAFS